MLRSSAVLAATLAFATCAAPPPAPPEAATPEAAASAPDAPADTPVRAPVHPPGTGLQSPDSISPGMHRGGEGMRHDGEGMHRHGEASHDHGGHGMHGREDGPRGGGPMGMSSPAVAEGDDAPVPDEFQEGERIFRQVCSACHTVDPPPTLAPPMRHVARHLRQAYTSEGEAVGHVLEFLPNPSRERSILPDMPHERFGLMPPQPLPSDLLEAVARYIWHLSGDG